MNARDLMPLSPPTDQPDPTFSEPPSVREAVNSQLDSAHTAPNGATVVVPIYPGQGAGDSVRIDWVGFAVDGSPVDFDDERPVFGGDVGREMTFTVPQATVEGTAGGHCYITYTVTAFGEAARATPQPKPQTSVPLTLTVLGGSDQPPAPTVDRVADGMLDPDANPGGTVAHVPAGVTQAGDVVHMHWIGATSYTDWFPVNAGTAGKALPFDIARNLIDESRNRHVSVYYEIERGGATIKSGTLRFSVGEVQLLPAPDLPDAVDDELDPGGITGDVPVVAPAEADLEAGDVVTVHVDGPKGSDTASRGVPGSGTGQSLTVLMPVKVFRDNLGEDVDVYYTVTRFVDGREDVSDIRTLRIRTAALVLPSPRIKEASGNELDPFDAADSLTATVFYNGAQPTDEVRVTWAGNGADGSYQSDWIFVGSVPRDIALDPAVVPFNIDRTVTVTYEVRRDGASAGVSDPLMLNVLALDTSPGGPLPTPQLKDIDGDELDLELVANGGVVTVTPPWPFIAEGQRFWLDLEGTDADGNPHTYRQANGVLVNAQHVEVGLTNRQVPASYFAPLADGSTLRIVFKVTFDGSANVADAVTFPLRTYTVDKMPTTLTEDFESAKFENIPVNGVVPLAFMNVKNLRGKVAIRLYDYSLPDSSPIRGKVLELLLAAKVNVEFDFPIRRIRLGCETGTALCQVDFYDANGKHLHSRTTPPQGSQKPAWFQYSRNQADIKSIVFTDNGQFTYLDNFTVEA
ncbi:hypothetical protein ACPWR0_05345 [Pandoraea pneumonica]|uniref:hypothetical protein n=1 Tax=Pandoraea pneumonica TaxID=2508299 RepID=UPI003CF96B1C